MSVSIIFSAPLNLRRGGPSGYIANLRAGFEKIGYNNVIFCAPEDTNINNKNKKVNVVKALLKTYAREVFRRFLPYIYVKRGLKKRINFYKEMILNLPCIREAFQKHVLHFHSTFDLFVVMEMLSSSSLILLTSHSPEAPHVEYFSNLIINGYEKKIAKYAMINYERIDEASFLRSDILVFPCKEALEPYYETWKDFEKIINHKRLEFIPTGVTPLEVAQSREQIRHKYRIPQNAFLVSYVGRHNYVKGYDILKEAAEIVWRKNKDIYFIIAGKEEPLKGIKDKRWIEVGWTNDPGSIIGSSDIFVLPNRRTFFDLILLEVLSIGKPVLASNTGGNKFVARQTDGVILFKKEDSEDLANKILEIVAFLRKDLDKLGSLNLKLYRNFYNEEAFAQRYKAFYESLG